MTQTDPQEISGVWRRSVSRTDGVAGRLKMRDWNYRHHQKCRGGKCRTGIIGTKMQGWKMRDQAAMESQALRFCGEFVIGCGGG